MSLALLANWAQFDGSLGNLGAPSILNQSARRGLNMAYAKLVENLNKEERAEFESEISMSMVELHMKHRMDEIRKVADRQRLAASFGEVG